MGDFTEKNISFLGEMILMDFRVVAYSINEAGKNTINIVAIINNKVMGS